MIFLLPLLAFLLLAVAPLAPLQAQVAAPAATALALTHATVVDVERGALLRDQVIIVRGDRIVQVAPAAAARIPAGARRVDLRGQFVIPGLWDMHVHLALDSALRTARDADVKRDATLRYFGSLFIANGVTGVRDLAGDAPTLQRIDNSVRDGTRVGPRLLYTGQKLGTAPVVPGAPFPVRTRDEVRASIAKLRASGGTFLKLAPMLDSAVVIAAYDECAAQQFPCVSHVPRAMPREVLAHRGIGSIEHLLLMPEYTAREAPAHFVAIAEERARPTLWQRALYKLGVREVPEPETRQAMADFDEAGARALFTRMAKAGVASTPTLFLHDIMKRAGERGGVARDTLFMLEDPTDGLRPDKRTPAQLAAHRQDWAFLERLVRMERDAGILLLAGTDLPLQGVPGPALHAELAMLQHAGLSPIEALRTATLNPARFFHATDTLGTVQAGRVADLVVLAANPLDDVANVQRVELVVARGRLYDRAAREALVRDARAARVTIRARPAEARVAR